MKGKSKLAAATVLAAAAAIFGACRADDTSGGAGASQAAPKNTATDTTAAKPSPSVVAQAPAADDARRVKAEELKSLLDSGKAALYDTRAKAAYDAEHIKGALSMPSNEVADRAGELPRDKTLVFYCT